MALLGSPSESRRRAGTKVLSNLALLAKVPVSENAPTARSPSDASIAHDGAFEALRHVVLLSTLFPSRESGEGDGCFEKASVPMCRIDVGGVGPARVGAKAAGDWVQQTLAPLLSYRYNDDGNAKSDGLGAGATVGAACGAGIPPRDPRQVWASLAVADAIVRAAQDASSGGEEVISALALQAPLISGLLALARRPASDFLYLARAAAAEAPASLGSQGEIEQGSNTAARALAGDDEEENCSDLADAAMSLAKSAAALCPKVIWDGIREEVLPILKGTRSGNDTAARNVGITKVNFERQRAALVLRDMVDGMGTGVVPFATRLLPVALKGMMDSHKEVKFECSRLLSFSILVKNHSLGDWRCHGPNQPAKHEL